MDLGGAQHPALDVMKADRPREAEPAPLRCPFCREGLAPDASTITCGACLATHHGGCWEEGDWRCASCGSQGWLGLRPAQARRSPRAPRRRRRSREPGTQALRLLAVTLGLAVFTQQATAPAAIASRPTAPTAPAAPTAKPPTPSASTAPQTVERLTCLEHPLPERAPPCEVLVEAQHALASCQWELALSLLDEGLELAPDPAPLWVARACALRELGQLQRALEHLDLALEAYPRHLAWRRLRGDVHLEFGHPNFAIADYRRVIAESERALPRLELRVVLLERYLEELRRRPSQRRVRLATSPWEAQLLQAELLPRAQGLLGVVVW